MGESGGGAVVDAAEVGDLGGGPVGQAVAAGHGFEHPGVDREGFGVAEAEEGDAVGDLFTYAGEGEEARFGGGVGQGGGLVQPGGVGGEEVGGLFDGAGAEAEFAGAEVRFGGGGELGPGGEGAEFVT